MISLMRTLLPGKESKCSVIAFLHCSIVSVHTYTASEMKELTAGPGYSGWQTGHGLTKFRPPNKTP